MRLFFALWPDNSTQQQWAFTTEPFVQRLVGKASPTQNLHLTLQFLGDVEGTRIRRLHEIAQRAVDRPIDFRFDRIECWRDAQLACLRPDHEPSSLVQLVNQLQHGLAMEGFKVERKKFKAHITLARHLQHYEAALPLWPALTWRASTLALVRSRLSAQGSLYAPVGLWPLAD
ncbi:RNA 2',3'-cyclic phosphodiesterase [Agitococcus lubricus]|uniref:RNA 2',3'-cyclic phosphodiesterase n=1 Tax=Agitococcus lubricus TaxID=1077255 RepID=A0A2T5IZW4_9GAMM|nr:RNA 2',3'-cyclic phosphodiesterase [Agitococcus lubricus]PTQ89606.1 2'-5' RNA ligase [Agitococcus lubricus]